MPSFRSRTFAVMLDMAGCPNRCRHCWLGVPPNRRVSEDTLRQVVRQYREWVRPGESRPFAGAIGVYTWYREPDYAPNYKELWELEKELSDKGQARRFELLSIWRLARVKAMPRGRGTPVRKPARSASLALSEAPTTLAGGEALSATACWPRSGSSRRASGPAGSCS
ncbi:MAG: radical SAM protein [Anaerolineae bacterium]|nr:radical SAM protein [Anaerolineae bacterium]